MEIKIAENVMSYRSGKQFPRYFAKPFTNLMMEKTKKKSYKFKLLSCNGTSCIPDVKILIRYPLSVINDGHFFVARG
jgi:hypothetical protein